MMTVRLPCPGDVRRLTREDLWSVADYAASRRELRAEILGIKAHRRIEVGPHAAFIFENWATMWFQVHEMLFIERGGEEQIADELSAYAPMVPGGNELVATVMFEIPDVGLRHRILSGLGGVEETFFLEVGGVRAVAEPERDVDRTSAAGKASSVHFVHFRLGDEQAELFRVEGTRVVVGMEHSNYGHTAVLTEASRRALASDL
ncbi:MAG: DUF3501 family protein [Alphaproteobacteria bacterium]|nr:DUF3501 family protein [Alphaproteobacteria bacterium]MDA8031759.1 DUF3501 family protein [Alphaproteobacteria bacterium]